MHRSASDNEFFAGERSISISEQMQVIELSQIEDEKINTNTQFSLSNANQKHVCLLEERNQEITLAAAVCPVYDKDNAFWVAVTNLKVEIYERKKEICELTRSREVVMKQNNKSTMMAKRII